MSDAPKIETDDVRLEKNGHVAIVTLNRPEKYNAITFRALTQLNDAFIEIDADDTLLAAIITGAGPKAFCAGGDLAEFIPLIAAGDYSKAVPDPTKRMFSDVAKPIIAAVNGACLAGGMEVLLGTDMRIAAEHATFGTPEVKHGLLAAGGTHARLTRQIPFAVAMEMLLAAQPIDARRAYEVGLINAVVPAEKLMEKALELAHNICRNGPIAVRAAKEAAIRGLGLEMPFCLEALMAPRVFGSDDAQEGLKAFIEKRRPHFTGK